MASGTVYTGNTSTYNLTTGLYLDMEPLISMLSPYDVPLTGGYGADSQTVLSTGTCFEKKVEWLDETLLTPRSAIATTTTTADGFIVVTSGEKTKFTTGDIVLVNSEYMRVTGYGTTADSLLVTRSYNSSSAVTVATGAVVVGVGTALAEGSDPSTARYVDRSNRFNVTEIFGPIAVTTTGTDNVVRKYGVYDAGTTEFEKQVANRFKEQNIALEQATLYGTRLDDTTNNWRTMGGLQYWITTNVDSATTTITEATLLTQMQAAFDAGGAPDRLVVGSKQKKIISGFTVNVALRTDRLDLGRGFVVDYFDSDFGRITVVLDRWVRTADAFLFNRDQAEIDTLRPWVFEQLAKTGDSMKGQILSEKTLKFRRERHAARFSALT